MLTIRLAFNYSSTNYYFYANVTAIVNASSSMSVCFTSEEHLKYC